MRNFVYILFVFSSLFAISCDELDSDIQVNKGESKLVLLSFLSPSDSEITVTVQQTQPLLGEQIDPIVRNAVVTLIDGTDTLIIPFSESNNTYLLAEKVKPNTKYTLRAETPDGRWAEAECTTLQTVALDFNHTIDSTISNSGIEYRIKMEWKDSAGLGNTYYRTDAELYYIVIDTVSMEFEFIARELNPVTSEVIKGIGNSQTMSMEYLSNVEKRNIEKYLELHLFMIDDVYYKFEQTKKSNWSGFPNYEYSKLYTNVKNGYGIVASFHNYVVKPLNIN